MSYRIKNAVIIGAGTMGAAIAAMLANANVKVKLLDIVPKTLIPGEETKGLTLNDRQVRNRIASNGLEGAKKSRPASFVSKAAQSLVSVGNIEDDLEQVKSADWVIEVIIENLKIKQGLMEKIDQLRGEQTIVSSNTSGISISAICAGRSDLFKEHFLGTHFFNPPRYLKLLEIIPHEGAKKEIVEFIAEFAEQKLGKGVVFCKDTPNFIANRIGAVTAAYSLDYIKKNQYTIPEVDALTGPAIGRPKTATFRLLDLIGIDVMHHVINNLSETIPADKYGTEVLNAGKETKVFQEMVEKGWLGNKSKSGFYKMEKIEGKKEFYPLNLQSMKHESGGEKPKYDSLKAAKDEEELLGKLNAFLDSDDHGSELIKHILFQGLSYSANCLPEIADSPLAIDQAMKWGFGHEAGPFEIWDMLGVEDAAKKIASFGFTIPDWINGMLEQGEAFYQDNQVYDVQKQVYVDLVDKRKLPTLKTLKQSGKVLEKNLSASIIDLGDGILNVEFHTKMNTIDDNLIAIIERTMDIAESDFEGIVIANEAQHFCAGANIFGVVMAAQNGMWDMLEGLTKSFQNVNMRMRLFHKPIVFAPAGLAIGGGLEMTMHASRVVAAMESYMGLVEVGVGVIPAGGGTKEVIRRIISPAMKIPDTNHIPLLQHVFEYIGQGKVATSAAEAQEFGFLSSSDRIVMNKNNLIEQAKAEALHMANMGYQPQQPEKVYAAGRDALAALRVALYMFKESGFISDYDAHVGEKLAYVLTGGELSKPTWVDEQYILDLERDAFLSLCGEEKTQARMWHMLQTGKPLRN